MYEKLRNQLNQMQQTLPTGYLPLDRLTGGLPKEGLTVVASRPAMGRTGFVLGMASRLAEKISGTILIFSGNESEETIGSRLLSCGTGFPISALLDGSVSRQEGAERVVSYLARQQANIKIAPWGTISVEDMEQDCFDVPDLRLIIVDNFEYLAQWKRGEDGMMHEVPLAADKRMQGLKKLAQTFHVPVVCTLHLHRRLERRKDKCPRMTDLKAMGLEEDLFDQVFFLYRPAYYDPYTQDGTLTNCVVARNQIGDVGTVPLDIDWKLRTFTER